MAAAMTDRIYAAASIDVEEEGLFRGVYERLNPAVTNTGELWRIKTLLDLGMRPSLFCAYSVFADPASRRILENLEESGTVEIGAHLHHWNTPPLDSSFGRPHALNRVPAREVELDILEEKLSRLLQMGADFLGEPIHSFRMGRWDLHRPVWGLLQKHGIKCDASVRPLHCGGSDSPDHFAAWTDPYMTNGILEVPMTVVPLMRSFSHLPERPSFLRSTLKHWGALALLPVEHPLWLMKQTTRMHIERGFRVLSFTWHSSEMMPGGAPHIQDEGAVQRLLNKLALYMRWLKATYDCKFVTMKELHAEIAAQAPVKYGPGDWNGGC